MVGLKKQNADTEGLVNSIVEISHQIRMAEFNDISADGIMPFFQLVGGGIKAENSFLNGLRKRIASPGEGLAKELFNAATRNQARYIAAYLQKNNVMLASKDQDGLKKALKSLPDAELEKLLTDIRAAKDNVLNADRNNGITNVNGVNITAKERETAADAVRKIRDVLDETVAGSRKNTWEIIPPRIFTPPRAGEVKAR